MKITFICLSIAIANYGCTDKTQNDLEYSLNVISNGDYFYNILNSGPADYIFFNGYLITDKSLKEIYRSSNNFNYAHIVCDEILGYFPRGSVDVDSELIQNNYFKYKHSISFCPKDDANSRKCVKSLPDFSEKFNKNLNCKINFGSMFKSKTIINNFDLDIKSIKNARKMTINDID